MAAIEESVTAAPRTLESFSPTSGELGGSVPTIAPASVQGVVDEVAQVQPFWAQLALADRSRYLRRTAQVILDEIDEIRDLIAGEQGKPRTEAYTMELLPPIDARHGLAARGPEIVADEHVRTPQPFRWTKRSKFVYEPLGVVGVIAPWNYPWTIPLGEVAMALMAGNGVVLKPASMTCLIGQRIEEVFARAGVPEGLLRTVHGGGAVGRALAESNVAKVFFTGSVEVGQQVGPMISREQFETVRELVDDAVAAGATLRCGGPVEVTGLAGAFYAPAVLTDVTHEMRIMREEIFGPVLPIVTVDSEDEAIALANDSQFGLGASVWTRDRAKGERISREIEAGGGGVNEHMYSHAGCQCARGGAK